MKPFKISLFALAVFANGCSHYYYAPNKVNMPGLREKNDLRLEAGIAKGWLALGGDAQVSYAVAKGVGIMVNGALTQSVSYSEIDKGRTKSAFIEGGIGYFRTMDTQKKWLFEIYGGGGVAEYKLFYETKPSNLLTTNNFFIQPSFVFSVPGRNFELGFATRFRGVNFLALKTSAYPLYSTSETRLLDGPMKGFWEPSFRLSAGGERVRFYLSYTISVSLNQAFVEQEMMNLGTGVRFNLNTSQRNR